MYFRKMEVDPRTTYFDKIILWETDVLDFPKFSISVLKLLITWNIPLSPPLIFPIHIFKLTSPQHIFHNLTSVIVKMSREAATNVVACIDWID